MIQLSEGYHSDKFDNSGEFDANGRFDKVLLEGKFHKNQLSRIVSRKQQI